MSNTFRFLAILCLVTSRIGASVQAEQTVLLRDGGSLTAESLDQSGDAIVVNSAAGVVWTFQADAVAPPPLRAAALVEYENLAPQVEDSPAGHWQMAEWCRDMRLRSRRESHLRRVVELEPDHADARKALGYSRVGDQWMTREERMAAEGYIYYEGKYRTQQEIDHMQAGAAITEDQNAWRRKLKIYERMMDRGKFAAAERNIAAIEDPAAAVPLAEKLSEANNFDVRLMYIDAIGKLYELSGAGAAPLVDNTLYEEDNELRLTCLDHLARRKNEAVVERFVETLKSEENYIINRAAEALEELEAMTAVPALVDALVTRHSRTVVDVGPQYNIGFDNQGGGGISAGRRPTRTIVEDVNNESVLSALVVLTGQDFGFNQRLWRSWLEAQDPNVEIDLRRDDE